MAKPLTESELEAYLDEALPIEVMTRIERALREDPKLVSRLGAINARRDAGLHSLGEIWRRHRLSCPPREQLGSYLLGVLPAEAAVFIKFHVEVVGCRVCLANLDDLRSRHTDPPAAVENRRRKYFQSSAGRLAQP
ncbi:MAG TPA: hypothetical protein VHV08_17375 [Pirellulales bacterium]|jgi:hypothetical protein|nr:hypothetical protein [Pirellulales bacterium]